MPTDSLTDLFAMAIAAGIPPQRLKELAMTSPASMPMMGDGGVTLVDDPTLVGGNTAVVPVTRPARPGAGKGASIEAEDFIHALSVLPKEYRQQYMKNIRSMGLKMAKEGAALDLPEQGIAGEAGLEVLHDAQFMAAGGVTGEGEDEQLPFNEDELQFGTPGEEPVQYYEDPDVKRMEQMQMAKAGMPDLPAPADAPPPPNQAQSMGKPVRWEVRQRPDGYWEWVPVGVPAGAGQAAGGSGPLTDARPDFMEQNWDAIRAEDLFPGVSKEWAEFLKAQSAFSRGGQGAGTGQGTGGASNVAAPTGGNPAGVQSGGYNQAAAGMGQGVTTGGSPAQQGSPSGSGQASAAAGSGLPAGAGVQGSSTSTGTGQASPEEEYVEVDYQGRKMRVPVSQLRGLQQDYQGGYRPSQEEEANRIAQIAAGTLNPTRIDQTRLSQMPLPRPGETFMSQADGTVYRWDRDRDGKWTLYRQTTEGEATDSWERSGKVGHPGMSEYGWMQIRSTNDINEVRQMQSMVSQGNNAAVVRNDAFFARQPGSAREAYELDETFRGAANQALTTYDSPEALQGRVAAASERDPVLRQQLASQLIEGGQLPAPTKEELQQQAAKNQDIIFVGQVLVRDSQGKPHFMQGVTFEPTGEGQGTIILPDGRRYEYREGRTYLPRVGAQLPWNPEEDVPPPAPNPNSYQVEEIPQEEPQQQPVQQQQTSQARPASSQSRQGASQVPGLPAGATTGPMGSIMTPAGRLGNGTTVYRGNDGQQYVFVGGRWMTLSQYTFTLGGP